MLNRRHGNSWLKQIALHVDDRQRMLSSFFFRGVCLSRRRPFRRLHRTHLADAGRSCPNRWCKPLLRRSIDTLWIGTTGGLLRFDGERFLTFDRENTPAFSENNVFCLMVSRDDSLWIGMEGGGLLRYKEGKFRSFSTQRRTDQRFRARRFIKTRQGKIWVGTDNGLFQIIGERLERIDNSDELAVDRGARHS